MTITNTTPAQPAGTTAKPIDQHARNVPATRNTRCSPSRLLTRVANREPISPPAHGAANASPYCHGAMPSSPSMRTARSGAVARISALTSAVFKNSLRSSRCRAMYRQPSNNSRA